MSILSEDVENIVHEEAVGEIELEGNGVGGGSGSRPGGGTPAYMNRLFCSTKEKIGYVLKTCLNNVGLGKYDVGGDYYMYDILGLDQTHVATANVGLGVYDMLNDPLTATIIDRMRTRWGKFKPFQYLSMMPNLVVGFIYCLLPLIALNNGYGESKRLWSYMIVAYLSETINAFVGGGGYIDNVFTPNPAERTKLLTVGKFVNDTFGISKLPGNLIAVLLDLVINDKIQLNVIKLFVVLKIVCWLMTTLPGIYWTFVSKERVAQSQTPPSPKQSIISIFKNKPLLIYTLSGALDGMNIGTSESLYYNDVLRFNSIGIIGGIPGAPISLLSYGLVPKLRERFSTKSMWLMQRGSVVASEFLFLLIGCIGGKMNGLYNKKIPMTIAFGLGNCIEMAFYATKQIIGQEVNYEIHDYCEWKTGFRVEATVNMFTTYFGKLQGILLKIINAWLLKSWAKFVPSMGGTVQTLDTQWKVFIGAYAPHILFDFLSMVPMFFYNIDKNTRDRMYLDLEKSRSLAAMREDEALAAHEPKIPAE